MPGAGAGARTGAGAGARTGTGASAGAGAGTTGGGGGGDFDLLKKTSFTAVGLGLGGGGLGGGGFGGGGLGGGGLGTCNTNPPTKPLLLRDTTESRQLPPFGHWLSEGRKMDTPACGCCHFQVRRSKCGKALTACMRLT